jgi:hypothetical protein
MSHILIFRDNFENMALVTITGYSWNYQRQAVINEERMAHSSKGWNYAACYETDTNKTYLVFTKEDKNCRKHEHIPSLPGNSILHCQTCGIELINSGKLPIYC